MQKFGYISALFCALLPILLGFPENQFIYSYDRDRLKNAELESHNKPDLNENEKVVNSYLQYLKWVEFEETSEVGFPPSRPIQDVLDHIITTKLYQVLKKLPKGGNMHSHENHELSKRTLLELIWDSPDDFEYLYITSENTSSTPWILDFFVTPPSDEWIKVKDSGLTIDEILPYQTLINVLSDEAIAYPTDTSLRWDDMDPLWDRAATRLVANINIKRKYLRALYEQCLQEGVQYIETRKNFGELEMLYRIDPNATTGNGKVFLENDEGALEINITRELIEEFQGEHPEFIGHRRITYSVRLFPKEEITRDMERAIKLHNMFPDHFVGYDLVAEEDNGNSHLYYLQQFLELYRSQTGMSAVPLYLHTAETNWADDLISSLNQDDPVATIQNLYEAHLLGAKRFGHALGLFKHPYLYDVIKATGAAIEVCPVSNQLLGFVPDLRSHPAQSYYRSGVPIVLGSDDPGTFGYDSFSVDWYHIYLAWGLDLADLKQLAINSLRYSSMSTEDQDAAITDQWLPRWNAFIQEMHTEACGADLRVNEPVFSMILPAVGARADTTMVHIYGRHFERAVCQTIKCYFGDLQSSSVQYMTNNHIQCEAPGLGAFYRNPSISRLNVILNDNGDVIVPVKVDLGDNVIRDIGQNFTYRYEAIPDVNGAASLSASQICMFFICLIVKTIF